MHTCQSHPCTKPLPPRRRRFCSGKCMNREASRVRRGTDWSAKPTRHPRTALIWEMRAEMDAEGGRGRCIFCPMALPGGRRIHCGAKDCEAEYQHMYHLGEMAEKAEASGGNHTLERTCAYGPCGATFQRREHGGKHSYCSKQCAHKGWRAKSLTPPARAA